MSVKHAFCNARSPRRTCLRQERCHRIRGGTWSGGYPGPETLASRDLYAETADACSRLPALWKFKVLRYVVFQSTVRSRGDRAMWMFCMHSIQKKAYRHHTLLGTKLNPMLAGISCSVWWIDRGIVQNFDETLELTKPLSSQPRSRRRK